MEMKRYWIREELSFIVLPDPQFSLQAGSAATIFRLPLMYCGRAWDGAPPTPLHREDPDAVFDLFLQLIGLHRRPHKVSDRRSKTHKASDRRSKSGYVWIEGF
ncbi:hypothetical protein EJB05_23147, partial [Eragrostis curvula]